MKIRIVFLLVWSWIIIGHAQNGFVLQSSLCKELNFAIQPPLFSPPPCCLASGNEIVNRIRPILKNRLSLTNYDRTFPVLQFLDHYEECKIINPNIRAIEAYKTFRFKPFIKGFRGGPCVTLTLDIYEAIPKDLSPYVVAAKLPGKFHQLAFPQFSHTAVLISYQNPSHPGDKGFVLIDPSFDIDEPILLKDKGDPYVYNMGQKGLWKFELQGDKIICHILNEESQSSSSSNPDYWKMTYFTTALVNPIESSAMPMILADRRYSLLSRNERGLSMAHLNVELNRDRVVWDQENRRFDPIDFKEFADNNWRFPEYFANALFIDSDDLFQKIQRIVKHKQVLDSLYLDYLNLILITNDLSITGPLKLEEVRQVKQLLESKN